MKVLRLKRNRGGFTLVEIMIVVAIIGMLAAVAVPNYVSARQNSRTKFCINNLRVIDHTKERLAFAIMLDTGDLVDTVDMDPYIKGGWAGLECPVSGTNAYVQDVVGTTPTCGNFNAASHDVIL